MALKIETRATSDRFTFWKLFYRSKIHSVYIATAVDMMRVYLRKISKTTKDDETHIS